MEKVVIVGCGHWGRNYVRILSGLLGQDRVVVVDVSDKALAALQKQYGGISVTCDLDAVLASGVCSMGVVATPAATHFDVVRRCLRAGLDVLAEKPLTLCVRESVALAGLSKRLGRVLMVGHTFLYNPAVRKVRELLEKGVCGDIYYLKATRTHLGLIRADVNAVWDLAPHDISIFNYLLNDTPVSVSAVGGCYLKKGVEDVAFINLTYPRNILASIHVSWADSNKERTVSVVGSRARVVFDDLNTLERVKIFEKGISANVAGGNSFGEFLFALRDGDIISPKIPGNEPLSDVCAEFLACVKSRQEPLAGAGNAVDVVRTMCAIQSSLKRSGRSVKVS